MKGLVNDPYSQNQYHILTVVGIMCTYMYTILTIIRSSMSIASMYVSIDMCIYIYIYTQCVFTHDICIHAYIHIYIYMYIHMYR